MLPIQKRSHMSALKNRPLHRSEGLCGSAEDVAPSKIMTHAGGMKGLRRGKDDHALRRGERGRRPREKKKEGRREKADATSSPGEWVMKEEDETKNFIRRGEKKKTG